MLNNQGYISIISLLVMSIILISAIFLIYTSRLEYIILNSSKNSIQASYQAESKIYLALNKEEYYYEQLLPRIQRLLKYGRLTPTYDYRVRIDKNDLIEGDNNVNIDISFSDDKRFMELKTYSTFNGIKKFARAKIILLNEFFDMGLSVVSNDNIETDKVKDYDDYMEYLRKEITIPTLDDNIIGIEAIDYENIKIFKDMDNKINIEFFRNNLEVPIRKQVLNNDKVFLIAKNKNVNPVKVSIESGNNLDKIILKGMFYLEGDFDIYNDIEFKGILIINNGRLYIDSSAKAEFEGIVLMQNHVEAILKSDNIKTNFNRKEIRKYGIYLPRFIEPKIQVMKCN